MVFQRFSSIIKRIYNDDKLVDNLIYLNDNFLFNNSGKEIHKVKKTIKESLTISNIVDTLNLYIHYDYPVDESKLISSWKTMKMYIGKCLER